MSNASGALVPEVTEHRDHMRGSGGPTLLIFGDYERPHTRAAYRSVQSLIDGLRYAGSGEQAELRRALSMGARA